MMGQLDQNDIMAGPLGQWPDSYVYARVCVCVCVTVHSVASFVGEVDVFIPYSGEPTVVYLASYFLAAAAGCALTCCLWLPNTLSVAVSDRPQHASVWRPELLFMCPEKEKKTLRFQICFLTVLAFKKEQLINGPKYCYNPRTLKSFGVISFFHFSC